MEKVSGDFENLNFSSQSKLFFKSTWEGEDLWRTLWVLTIIIIYLTDQVIIEGIKAVTPNNRRVGRKSLTKVGIWRASSPKITFNKGWSCVTITSGVVKNNAIESIKMSANTFLVVSHPLWSWRFFQWISRATGANEILQFSGRKDELRDESLGFFLFSNEGVKSSNTSYKRKWEENKIKCSNSTFHYLAALKLIKCNKSYSQWRMQTDLSHSCNFPL